MVRARGAAGPLPRAALGPGRPRRGSPGARGAERGAAGAAAAVPGVRHQRAAAGAADGADMMTRFWWGWRCLVSGAEWLLWGWGREEGRQTCKICILRKCN